MIKCKNNNELQSFSHSNNTCWLLSNAVNSHNIKWEKFETVLENDSSLYDIYAERFINGISHLLMSYIVVASNILSIHQQQIQTCKVLSGVWFALVFVSLTRQGA